MAGGHPRVIAIHALDEGHRCREATPAVVGPPHVHGAISVGARRAEVGTVTRTRGTDVAPAVPAEGDGHVVASRPGRRLRWPAADVPAGASVNREIGQDELGSERRALAGDEELARVQGVRRKRRPDMLPVPVATNADVCSDCRCRSCRHCRCRAVAGGKRHQGRRGGSATEQPPAGDQVIGRRQRELVTHLWPLPSHRVFAVVPSRCPFTCCCRIPGGGKLLLRHRRRSWPASDCWGGEATQP